ncbi:MULTISPECIES: Uma2 family endonuclease [Kitasatospora]|uniref:Uma2 family endonuclease n=2 Tax=Kitasatospora TaxID=2063 RepID=A0ABT1ISM8_9ACTN|nr:Uma2 family endonuclease [Kitasatospora paracochleata]MCP2307601.1 Uma2 family endonuclease [Kitasatospora paracochleata]
MTALAHEADLDFEDAPDLDEVLWQAWKTLELPEGFRAEIVEGCIEVSPTGGGEHALVANMLRRELDRFLSGGEAAAYQDTNAIFGRKVWIPDVLVTAADLRSVLDGDRLGALAEHIGLMAEVVSPGHDARKRDLVRKRRAYARAGVPVYVIIDDFDGVGHVTVLSAPNAEKASYEAEVRMPYGTEVVVPDGPAKGFVIGVAITGEPRGA